MGALIAAGALFLLVGVPWMLWRGPYFLDGKYIDTGELAKGSAALVTGLRTAMVALIAALGAGIALLYTARTYRLTRRGQITDRFTKALERLGSNEAYVRIGGILALEQIVQDAPEQAATDAARVLNHFIRDRAPKARVTPVTEEPAPDAESEGKKWPNEPSPDVQAALTALTRPESRTHVDPRERLDLHGLHLVGAELNQADLTDADLRGATLRGAYLAEATLTKANLCGATLTKASLYRATLTGAKLQEAALVKADLREATLTGADLSRSTLTGANLRWADLTNADLERAILTDANLRQATLTETDLSSATLTGASMFKATLTNAHLGEAILTDAILAKATLTETSLHGATLTGASLVKATLTRVSLDGATLTNAKLRDAILTDPDLHAATLTEADLEGTDLSSARHLTQEQASSAITYENTKLPSVFWEPTTSPAPTGRPLLELARESEANR
ncbi:pentapeptide repeat-containing protein [Streptomyces mirabilis]|uniref:pentapeptide repeat-containing protein n=1 Tax=Streptomyces mirabilis TaxID=68239 RepID=UPI00379D325C